MIVPYLISNFDKSGQQVSVWLHFLLRVYKMNPEKIWLSTDSWTRYHLICSVRPSVRPSINHQDINLGNYLKIIWPLCKHVSNVRAFDIYVWDTNGYPMLSWATSSVTKVRTIVTLVPAEQGRQRVKIASLELWPLPLFGPRQDRELLG